MSRRKGNGKASSHVVGENEGIYWLAADAKFGGYVDLRLTDDAREAFQIWIADPHNDCWKLLEDVVAEGMSFSLKWISESQTFLACLSGKGISNSNERYVLTARSPVSLEALGLAIYKHYELCRGSWDDFKPSTGQLSIWG